jgi:hypothetical protein
MAETSDLTTKFARIVVTDDRGRYHVPGVPQAGYDLWVRGTDWLIRRTKLG